MDFSQMAACTAAAANQRGCRGPSSASLQWPDFLHWRLESEFDIQGVQACNHAWRCREICSWNLEMASLRLQAKQNDYSTGCDALDLGGANEVENQD